MGEIDLYVGHNGYGKVALSRRARDHHEDETTTAIRFTMAPRVARDVAAKLLVAADEAEKDCIDG